MRAEWFSTAALLVSEGETRIAFDPFVGVKARQHRPEVPDLPGAEELGRAGNVFVTHGHFDHIIHIPEIYRRTGAVIHATAAPCATLVRQGFPEERLALTAPGGEYTVGDIRIRAFQGRHCQFDIPLVVRTAARYLIPGNFTHGLRLLRRNRQFPENGEILFYELECRDRRLAIMGSMGLDPGVDYPTGADVLILPYQGKSDPAEYAASLVERLRPRAVLLDHYDNSFPPMTQKVDTAAFERLVSERYAIPCRAMERGRIYEI